MVNPDLLKLFKHPHITIVLANQLRTSTPSIMRLSTHSLTDCTLDPNGNIDGKFARYCRDYIVHLNMNNKVHYTEYIDCIQPSRDRYTAQKQHHETFHDTVSHPYYISRYDVFFLITDTSRLTNIVDPHRQYLLVLINLFEYVEYEFHHKVHGDNSTLLWVEYQELDIDLFNTQSSITDVSENIEPQHPAQTSESIVDSDERINIKPTPHRPKLSISNDCWFANVYRKPQPKVQPKQQTQTFASTWNYIYSSAWNYLSTFRSNDTIQSTNS